ncbi:MAG: signal peptidase I [Bacilli bacterium]
MPNHRHSSNKNRFTLLKTILLSLIIVFVIRTFLFEPILVDGKSMDPTLHNRERMILNKWTGQWDDYGRFDIVVFEAHTGEMYIKRIIGLPGEHVAYRNDTLYINGKPFAEPYLDTEKQNTPVLPLTPDFTLEDITGQMTIPKGYIFVLGDNRDGSSDSRAFGCVALDKVAGTAHVVFYPFDAIRVAD